MNHHQPEQLHFQGLLVGAADRVVSPKIATPVLRWRKMVRLFDPPAGARCSGLCFQAVAGALADYANRNGSSCFPAVKTLAKDSRCSKRQVQYALAALERWGLLVRDHRGGRGRTTRYELICRRAVDKAVDESVDAEQLDLERVRLGTWKGCDQSHPRSVSEDRHMPPPRRQARLVLVTT